MRDAPVLVCVLQIRGQEKRKEGKYFISDSFRYNLLLKHSGLIQKNY